MRHVRNDRRQGYHGDFQGFLLHEPVAARRRRKLAEAVQELHDGSNRGVESLATTDVVGHLGERLMRQAANPALRLGQFGRRTRRAQRRCRAWARTAGHVRDVIVNRLPETLDEAIRAVHTLVRPLQRLLGRRCEHREQTRGIRAEFFDERLGVDTVVLGLGHRDHAAGLHREPVGAQYGDSAAVGEIALDLDIGWIEILDPAGGRFAEKNFVEHHALREQMGEGLLERHGIQIVHHAGPEA